MRSTTRRRSSVRRHSTWGQSAGEAFLDRRAFLQCPGCPRTRRGSTEESMYATGGRACSFALAAVTARTRGIASSYARIRDSPTEASMRLSPLFALLAAPTVLACSSSLAGKEGDGCGNGSRSDRRSAHRDEGARATRMLRPTLRRPRIPPRQMAWQPTRPRSRMHRRPTPR